MYSRVLITPSDFDLSTALAEWLKHHLDLDTLLCHFRESNHPRLKAQDIGLLLGLRKRLPGIKNHKPVVIDVRSDAAQLRQAVKLL